MKCASLSNKLLLLYLAFAPEKRQYLEDRIFDKSSDADVGLGDSWQALQGESSERSFAGGNDAQLPRADGEGMRTIFLSRPALAIDSVNQTLLEPSLPFANAFCQTETSTKDASVQTDCSLPEKIQKQIKIQTDPIRFLAIKKILSSPPSSVAFKNVIDTDEPPAAKRPRKVRPSKAVIYNSCTPTTTSVVKTSCGSSTTFFNNVFSGSPLFNSIAPSQPGLTLKTSRASLQGNIYTYCRQAGMVVPMQQSHQQNSFLNPRVVLSPLPLLSPNDIGPQGDNMYRQRMQNFKRNQLEPRYSFPYIRNKVPQQQILPSPNLTEKNDQSKLSAADITTTAFTLSPFYISKVSDGLPFKTECTADSGFPIPNTSSAFLPNSSHDLLLKRHFDDQHTTPKTAKN